MTTWWKVFHANILLAHAVLFFCTLFFWFTWKRQQWNKQCNSIITSTKTSNTFVFSMPKKQKTRDAEDNGDFSTPPQFLRCLPKGIKPSRKLNPSQMDALDSAAANTLTLIQGPPGAKKKHWLEDFVEGSKRLVFFFFFVFFCSACYIFGIVIFW